MQPRTGDHLLAGMRERDEMAGEVSAVDRRDVLRFERSAVRGVIPVVEVPAKALETVHRVQCGFETLDRIDGAEPAEIPGRHRRQHIQSDVGGRCAMRHDRARRFLKVVGG